MSLTKQMVILGVGRSGTTAIYSLLQTILKEQCPKAVDYVYEPYLWDRATFNKPYEAILAEDWQKCGSLSLEGMYHHKKTPILVDNVETVDTGAMCFAQSVLTPSDKTERVLCKMIRANGRLDLLRTVAPEARIVVIIRHPVDVINSSINFFSFFGDEFYASDYDRFIAEVKRSYGDLAFEGMSLSTREEREYAYWYFSNRFLVDRVAQNRDNVFPIVYEDYLDRPAVVIQQLCEFLGLEFHGHYCDALERKVGRTRGAAFELTRNGYDYILGQSLAYNQIFADLVAMFPFVQTHRIGERRAETQFAERVDESFTGLNSLNARARLRQTTGDLVAREEKIARHQAAIVNLEGELQSIRGELTTTSRELQRSKDHIAKLTAEIGAYKEEIRKVTSDLGATRTAVAKVSAELKEQSETLSRTRQSEQSLKHQLADQAAKSQDLARRHQELQKQKKTLEKMVKDVLDVRFSRNPIKKFKLYKALGRHLSSE